MRERSIAFDEPKVRAVLSGMKTQDRQLLEPQPTHFSAAGVPRHVVPGGGPVTVIRCPFGQPGDRLWVRETWRHTASDLDEARRITEDICSGTAVDYRATYIDDCMRELGFSREDAELADQFEEWRPLMTMPRWASRIALEITAVRAEQLQDISEADAKAEGITPREVRQFWLYGADDKVRAEAYRQAAVDPYREAWESIHGPGSWAANPWVWVIEFKPVKP